MKHAYSVQQVTRVIITIKSCSIKSYHGCLFLQKIRTIELDGKTIKLQIVSIMASLFCA